MEKKITLLQDQVQKGLITSQNQLQTVFKRLSKTLQSETGTSYPLPYKQLLEDRNLALERLVQAPLSTKDFWILFEQYITQGNPKSLPSPIFSKVLESAQQISQELAQAIHIFQCQYRKPEDLNIHQTARFFFFGTTSLFGYLKNENDKDKNRAYSYFHDCYHRILYRYETPNLPLLALSKQLLSIGLSTTIPKTIDEILYTKAQKLWDESSLANFWSTKQKNTIQYSEEPEPKILSQTIVFAMNNALTARDWFEFLITHFQTSHFTLPAKDKINLIDKRIKQFQTSQNP